MKIDIKLNEDYLHTHVPNAFIDNYMPAADPVFSLIYIYLLRRPSADSAEIAKVFDITERKCVKALRFWEQEGLLSLSAPAKPAKSTQTSVLSPANEEAADIAVLQKPAQLTLAPQDTSSNETIITAEQERPSYTAQELDEYGKQEVIRDLFKHAEQCLGRMLRYNDLNLLFAMYDWLRLDTKVIKTLLDYCAEAGHTTNSYIEAVAIDWANQGIKTPEQALDYVKAYSKTYREIFRALGIAWRNPTPKEIAIMDKWLNEYEIPLEIVLEACDISVINNIKRSQFKYVENILVNWRGAGVKTLEDIDKYKTENAQIHETPIQRQPARRKTRFANFEGRAIDYNDIKQKEKEYINKLILNTATG